jgi:hypothetical protein
MSSSKPAKKPEPKKEQPVDNHTEEGTHKPMGIPEEPTLEDRVAKLEAEMAVMKKNCRRSHGPR